VLKKATPHRKLNEVRQPLYLTLSPPAVPCPNPRHTPVLTSTFSLEGWWVLPQHSMWGCGCGSVFKVSQLRLWVCVIAQQSPYGGRGVVSRVGGGERLAGMQLTTCCCCCVFWCCAQYESVMLLDLLQMGHPSAEQKVIATTQLLPVV
jgi:hypothetical protein